MSAATAKAISVTAGGSQYRRRQGGTLFSTGGTLSNINHPILSNCILVQNEGQDGGALYFDQYASGDVLNCTISGNRAQRGGGMFVFEAYSYTRVLNTILWGDTVTTGHPEIYFAPTGATGSKPDNLEVYYSDIMTGWDHVVINTGNLNVDPAFADLDGADNNAQTWQDNDYRLLPDSPLIDHGVSDIGGLYLPAAGRFFRHVRPRGGGFDIGGYSTPADRDGFQADFDLDYSYTAPSNVLHGLDASAM
jgi:hypothetical protein